MKRLLLSVLLSIFALAPLAASRPLASIQALVGQFGQIHCTVFSINEKKHLWATDFHCVDNGQGGYDKEFVRTPEKDTTIVEAFKDDDLVVLRSELMAPALPLSKDAPEVGDVVMFAGHGLGREEQWGSVGKVVGMDYFINPDLYGWTYTQHWMEFEAHLCKGHSGSPLINNSGRVVGVLQIGVPGYWNEEGTCATRGGSVQWSGLEKLRKYWEKK